MPKYLDFLGYAPNECLICGGPAQANQEVYEIPRVITVDNGKEGGSLDPIEGEGRAGNHVLWAHKRCLCAAMAYIGKAAKIEPPVFEAAPPVEKVAEVFMDTYRKENAKADKAAKKGKK
jgi:hypothetical protein